MNLLYRKPEAYILPSAHSQPQMQPFIRQRSTNSHGDFTNLLKSSESGMKPDPQARGAMEQSFGYSKLVNQKVYEQPKPRYIRDPLFVNDINQGVGMGQFNDTQPYQNNLEQNTHLGIKPLMGKPREPTRRRQIGLGSLASLYQSTDTASPLRQNAQNVMQFSQGSLNNKDIPGSNINLHRYERNNRQGYDTLDYSDVTHGNKEGSLGQDAHLTNNNNHRNKRNRGSYVAGHKQFPELSNEQILPHQMMAKVHHIENGQEQVKDRYLNNFQRQVTRDYENKKERSSQFWRNVQQNDTKVENQRRSVNMNMLAGQNRYYQGQVEQNRQNSVQQPMDMGSQQNGEMVQEQRQRGSHTHTHSQSPPSIQMGGGTSSQPRINDIQGYVQGGEEGLYMARDYRFLPENYQQSPAHRSQPSSTLMSPNANGGGPQIDKYPYNLNQINNGVQTKNLIQQHTPGPHY